MYSTSCNLYTALLIVKAFHGTGQYILSGGQDHVVNLVCFHALCSSTYQEITRSKWKLPEVPYDYLETQKPIVVHYPHFSTSEVHSNIVDWFVILQHTVINELTMIASHSTVISFYLKPSTSIVSSSGRSQALIPPPAYRIQILPRPTIATNAAHDQHSQELPGHPTDQNSMYDSYSSTSLAALNSTCASAFTRPFRPEPRTLPSQFVTAAPGSSSGTFPALKNTTVIPILPKSQTKRAFSHHSRLPSGSPLLEPRRRETTRANSESPALPHRHRHLSLRRAWGLSWDNSLSHQQAQRGNMPWTTL